VIEGKGVSALGALYVSGSSLLAGDLTVSSAASIGGNINSNTSMSIDDAAAILQLKASGVEKGFMQLSGDDLRLGTNAGNTLGNAIVRLNGQNRFQFAPTGRLSIMADQFPTLYFNTGGVNRAYLQLQGDNLRLDAPANKIYIGDDMTVDDATSRVGIGTTAPEQKLHITGNAKITGAKVLNNNNENMLPIAYGKFISNGTKQAGTSNISAVAITSGDDRYYVISVAGVDLSNAVASVTCGFATVTGYSPAIEPHTDPTKLRLTMIAGDNPNHMWFHIVIYKTN
jgi:hypothetical protein